MNLTSAVRKITPISEPFPQKSSATDPILGPFRFLEELGRKHAVGVFKALDLDSGRTVALKAIVAEGLSEEQLQPIRDALLREASIAGRLTHPGIVPVLGTVGDSAGNPMVVMDFVGAETLEDALEPGTPGEPVSLTKRFDIAIEIAGALEYMHRRGVVHRDIKPANILLTADGHPCLVDFGIAILVNGEDHLEGALPGTPAFVAPELLNDASASARSDIFSFGVLLYWMFTGKIPFTGSSVTEIMDSVAHAQAAPVQQYNWSLPRDLDWVLGRCLAKDPTSRYEEAGDITAELAALRQACLSSLLESIPAETANLRGGLRVAAPPPIPPATAIDSTRAAESAADPIFIFAKPSPARPATEIPAPAPRQREYNQAIETCRESLASAQKRFGNSHPRVADWMGQLAVLYHRLGDYDEAEDLHRRALRIREGEFGGSNEKVATSLNNLALVCRDQGKIKQAQQLLERSLSIVENVFGPEHPKTAVRLCNVADMLFEQKDYVHAERFYDQLVLILKRGQMGIPGSEVLASLNKYQALLRLTFRSEEANRLEAFIRKITKAEPRASEIAVKTSTKPPGMTTQTQRSWLRSWLW